MATGFRGRTFDPYEAMTGEAIRLEANQLYGELGLVPSSHHQYTYSELADLRRLKEMMAQFGREHPIVATLLRTNQRLLAAQSEVQELMAELRTADRVKRPARRLDVYWNDE